MNSCKFNCAQQIEKESQEMIFTESYKLGTNGKHSFIARTSVCSSVSENKESRKKLSYSYFLIKGEKSLSVFKNFYLPTLAVSQEIVYNVYQKKDQATGVIKPDGRGRHESHHRVCEEQKKGILEHINSFPVVESYYCLTKTNKTIWKLD